MPTEYLKETYGGDGAPEIRGLAREDYPDHQANVYCPWCGEEGGTMPVAVHVRAPDGGWRGTGAHPGYVHLAHLRCLDDESRRELHDRYPADHEDPESPGQFCCDECLSYASSQDLAALPPAPAGEPCWSCLEMLADRARESEEQVLVDSVLDACTPAQ